MGEPVNRDLALSLARFLMPWMGAVLVVAAVFMLAEAIHHSGNNPFMAMPSARALSAAPTEPVPVSSAHAVTIPIAGDR
jgi:hypothetical protein